MNDNIKIISALAERNRRKRAGLTLKRSKTSSGYEWSCEGQISQDEAQTLMRKSGYDSIVYGFWGYRFTDGKTEWQSSNNSD